MRDHRRTPCVLEAAPAADPGRFAWLEGATGVRLSVRAGCQRWTLVVAGEVDVASVEVIDAVVDEALAGAPAGVVLDLTRAWLLDGAALELVAGARARAEASHVPLLVRRTVAGDRRWAPDTARERGGPTPRRACAGRRPGLPLPTGRHRS